MSRENMNISMFCLRFLFLSLVFSMAIGGPDPNSQ